MPRGVYERRPWHGNSGHPVRVREEAAKWFQRGKTPGWVSKRIGVPASTLRAWKLRLEQHHNGVIMKRSGDEHPEVQFADHE